MNEVSISRISEILFLLSHKENPKEINSYSSEEIDAGTKLYEFLLKKELSK